MEIPKLIDDYAAGPQKLRDAIAGMTAEQIDAVPVPGKWSTRQVICHLADFEPVYADRMKHVIAEDQPNFAGGFHQQFAEHLAYDQRDIEEELTLVEVTRSSAAKRTEAEIRHLSHEPHRKDATSHDDIARRMEHMRIAVEHLNHAGLHDVAEHVAQRAEATERELHEHQKHQGGDVMHEIMKQLDELRHPVGRLRDDVSELRKKE